MARYSPLVELFVFGSLWGLSEVVGGKALYEANIPNASRDGRSFPVGQCILRLPYFRNFFNGRGFRSGGLNSVERR